MKNNTRSSGQSLIEVVVAIAVIVLVIVALISAITVGLANAQFARNKSLATKYSQEGIEWLRLQRDLGWTNFYNQAGPTGNTYCINTLNFSSSGTCSANSFIDDQYDLFTREATLTQNTSSRVLVQVKVYWRSGERLTDVVVDTYLTNWQ